MYLLQLLLPDGWDTADTTPCPRWALAWWEITRGGIDLGDAGAVGCRVVDGGGRVVYTYAA